MYLEGFFVLEIADSISKLKHLVARLQFPGLEIGKASMDACKTACMQDMDCKALEDVGMDCILVRKQSKVFQGPGKGDIPIYSCIFLCNITC